MKRGCGPDWAPKFIRECYFYDECVMHDIDYEERKKLIAWERLKKIFRMAWRLIGAAHRRRKKLDQKFLERMMKKADGNKLRIKQAYMFYYLVRLLGWFFYRRS